MNSSPLAPCPSCSRHVRSDSARCPFCAAAIAIAPASVVPASTTTLSRAAAFTFATTLALGCASTQEPAPQPPAPVATTEPTPAPPATPMQGPQDPGGMVAMYGAPALVEPVDAGPPAMDAAVDASAADVPAARPPHDAGHHAHPTPPVVRPNGSVGVRYGSPPRPED